jgi:phage host-nuclease inhibitor protein Gam
MSGEGESPGPGVNASIREQVAGLAVRQVLVTGLSIKLGRKQEEEKSLVRSNQAKQLKALRDEISALTKRIEELGPSRPRPPATRPA